MLANVLFSVKQGTELIPSFFSILQFEDVLFIFKENTLKKKPKTSWSTDNENTLGDGYWEKTNF